MNFECLSNNDDFWKKNFDFAILSLLHKKGFYSLTSLYNLLSKLLHKETCTRVKTFFVRQTQNCKIQVFDPKITETHQIDGKLILQCRLMIYVHN